MITCSFIMKFHLPFVFAVFSLVPVLLLYSLFCNDINSGQKLGFTFSKEHHQHYNKIREMLNINGNNGCVSFVSVVV